MLNNSKCTKQSNSHLPLLFGLSILTVAGGSGGESCCYSSAKGCFPDSEGHPESMSLAGKPRPGAGKALYTCALKTQIRAATESSCVVSVCSCVFIPVILHSFLPGFTSRWSCTRGSTGEEQRLHVKWKCWSQSAERKVKKTNSLQFGSLQKSPHCPGEIRTVGWSRRHANIIPGCGCL